MSALPLTDHSSAPRSVLILSPPALGRESSQTLGELARASSFSALLKRGVLTGGTGIVAGMTYFLATPGAISLTDPQLATLLKGMAAIKAVLLLATLALLWWRSKQPVESVRFTGYCACTWSMAIATVLIWQLSSVPLAAILFHGGALGIALCALRDDGLPDLMRGMRRRQTANSPRSGQSARAQPGPARDVSPGVQG